MRIVAMPAFKARSDNPYTWLLYSHLSALGAEVEEFSPSGMVSHRYDVWHLHWPEYMLRNPNPVLPVMKLGIFRLLISLARRRGTRIVWTVHNLQSHEPLHSELELQLRRLLVPNLDGVIAMTESGLAAARARFPVLQRVASRVIPHGHYIDVYPNRVTRSEARNRLGLASGDRVILFLGHVRPYKNVPRLIECFSQVTDESARLVIAGKPLNQTVENEIRARAGRDHRVLFHLHHVPDEEMQVYLNACDIVALPFAEILNSGSAVLSLSFGKPILVPGAPALLQLKTQFGDAAVKIFHGELTPRALHESLSQVVSLPVDPNVLTWHLRRELGWDTIAKDTYGFYQLLRQ